jgi:hypothetical protein
MVYRDTFREVMAFGSELSGDRRQVCNTAYQRWTKRDSETERFMDHKADGEPCKGVRKEQDIRWDAESGNTFVCPLLHA